MKPDKYFLVLSGTLIDGHEREQVQASLQHLLRVSPEQAQSMLAGERSRIRKQLTLEKAKHLRDKLAACGAGSFIEPVERKRTQSTPQVTAAEGEGRMEEAAHLGAAVDVAEEGPLFEAGAEGQQAAADVFSEPPVDEEIEAPAKRQDAAQSDIEAAAEPGPSAVEDAPDVPLDDSLELVLEPVPEKPAAGDEDTRPLQAVPAQAGVDQDTEEIVLESELVKLESPGGDAQTPVDTAAAAPESVAKRRQPSVFGGKRLLLLGGVLVVLAGVAAGGLYFFGGGEAPGSGVKQQAQAQVDSKQAVTERRLESLGRSVRAWMKFYGSGDPAQVTLDRMQQDLGLAEAEMQDAWGTAIRYQPGSPSYTMLSAGPDRKFSTADDLKLALKVE